MLRSTMITCSYKICGKLHGSSQGLHFDDGIKEVYCNPKCYVEDYFLKHTGRQGEIVEIDRGYN
jgi:hypothetical protein